MPTYVVASNALENKGLFVVDSALIELINSDSNLIYDAYDNVISVEEIILENGLDDNIQAYQCNVEGEKQELECDVVLNKITYQKNATTRSNIEKETATMYILTARATSKTSDGEVEDHDVVVQGTIGWSDALGIVNTFEYVSGSRSGAYTGTGYYQALRGTRTLCNGNFDVSFYDTSQYEDSSGTGFRLIARTSTADGNEVQLNFTTSVFD